MKKKETEEMQEKIENEIKERKKMPSEVKKQRDKKVLRNLLFAVAVIVYFILLNLGYYSIEKDIYTKDTVVFSLVTLITAIILFERAYKTEKGYYVIHGLEVLTISIFTYFVPFTYFSYGENVTKAIMVSPVIFGIYYCIKGIVICLRAKKDKKNDIKEITKKEEIKDNDTWIKIDKDVEAEKEVEKKNTEKKKMQTETSEKSKKAKATTARKSATKADKVSTSKVAKSTKKTDEEKPKATRTKQKTKIVEEPKQNTKTTTRSNAKKTSSSVRTSSKTTTTRKKKAKQEEEE